MWNGICGIQISSLIEQQPASSGRTNPSADKSFHQCTTFVSVSSGVSSHTDKTTTNIEEG